ncbi:hypothetical protein [Pseudomonas cremoricolorata]|uniref:hypothetical protein n=1 Tax=Pseudomonas cremoricolorata TaxID=157783 RepID=UPI001969D08A|nr:hypothetical protein [Pseudomonas cremoricolorata]
MSRIPTAWMDELDDQVAFLMDPDGREAVLSEMAVAAHRAGRIDACVLADMLELAEAGRLWAMEDLETVFPMPAVGEQKDGWGVPLSRTERVEPGRLTGGWDHLDIPVVNADGAGNRA